MLQSFIFHKQKDDLEHYNNKQKRGPLPPVDSLGPGGESELLQALVSWSPRIKKIKIFSQRAKRASFCILSLVLTVSLKKHV